MRWGKNKEVTLLMKEVFWKGNEGFLGKSEELGEGPDEEEEVRGGLRFVSVEGVGVTGTLRCEVCWLWSTGQDTVSLASRVTARRNQGSRKQGFRFP